MNPKNIFRLPLQLEQLIPACIKAMVEDLPANDTLVEMIKLDLSQMFDLYAKHKDKFNDLSSSINFYAWRVHPDDLGIEYYTQDIILSEFSHRYGLQNFPEHIIPELAEALLTGGNREEIITSLFLSQYTTKQLLSQIRSVAPLLKKEFLAYYTKYKDVDFRYFENHVLDHELAMTDFNFFTKGILAHVYGDLEIRKCSEILEKILNEEQYIPTLPPSSLIALLVSEAASEKSGIIDPKFKEKSIKFSTKVAKGLEHNATLGFITLVLKNKLDDFTIENLSSSDNTKPKKYEQLGDLLPTLPGYIRIDTSKPRGKILEYLKLKPEKQDDDVILVYEECYDKEVKSGERAKARGTVARAVKDLNKQLGAEVVIQKNWKIWWQNPA